MKSRALTELVSKLSAGLVRQSLRKENLHKVLASKAETKQYFEVAKDLLYQLGRTEQTEKYFSTISWVSVSLFTAQAISPSFLGVLTNASSAFLHCLQELWICYDTKRLFQPALMVLRVIALYSLYLFVYQRDKICRGTLRARFSQMVFSIS